MNREDVKKLLFACLETLNGERAGDAQIAISEDTELLSDNSTLDSLGFVSFSTDLEDRLLAKTGKDLMLASSALSSGEHPFRSVRTLTDFITARLASP